LDTKLLRASFDLVAPQAADLAKFFYAEAFRLGGTEVQQMFPPLMTLQRDRLLAAIVQVITKVDDIDDLTAFLTGLGRDHRKFTVKPEHYDVIGQALLTTLAHFAGEAWTEELQQEWAAAYAVIAQVMKAGSDSDDGPAWWDATVISREARGPSVAVIRLRLDQPMTYAPGQSMAVQFPDRAPRVWRFYSPANAADGTGILTFHVKIEGGGLLSAALGMHASPGDRLRLGPPVGNLKLDEDSARNIRLIAGSTGLAPLLAIIQAVAARPQPPAVHLFFGAQTPDDLYALADLEKLAATHDWLTVTYAVSADPGETPGYAGEHGSVVDVAASRGDWLACDAYVCGSSPMVKAATGRLTALGMPGAQVHTEDFGWEG
jgi:NAD(P)H-flavin reductase